MTANGFVRLGGRLPCFVSGGATEKRLPSDGTDSIWLKQIKYSQTTNQNKLQPQTLRSSCHMRADDEKPHILPTLLWVTLPATSPTKPGRRPLLSPPFWRISCCCSVTSDQAIPQWRGRGLSPRRPRGRSRSHMSSSWFRWMFALKL